MDLNRYQAKYLAFTELIGQVGTSDLTAANTFMDMGLSCVEVVRFFLYNHICKTVFILYVCKILDNRSSMAVYNKYTSKYR